MTRRQHILLFAQLWPDACATQGWDESDRALRLEVLGDAIGREIRSTSDIDSTRDFDLVKARCLLLRESITGAVEDGHPEIGQARRVRFKIKHAAPAAYTAKILFDKFSGRDIDDLNLTELNQLLYTLAARAVRLRRGERTEPVAVQSAQCPF